GRGTASPRRCSSRPSRPGRRTPAYASRSWLWRAQGGLAQYPVERREELLDVVGGPDERRLDLDDVVVRAVDAQEDAEVLGALHDVPGLRPRGLARAT